MTNYQNTKIYKIESDMGDKIYVGSTAKDYLSQRFQQHKSSYKQWKNGKCGKITSYELFDEYGVENCKIVLIEEYPCNSKDAKNAREGYHIKELNCVNKNIAGRTKKEYQQSDQGKEAIKDTQKKYQQSEKGKEATRVYKQSEKGKKTKKTYQQSEKGKEAMRVYKQSEKGKEVIKKYIQSDKGKEVIKKYIQSDKGKETIKESQKKYYEEEKGTIQEVQKKYYELNKVLICSKRKERYQLKKAEKLELEKQNEPIAI
jgi:hypothetical protein